MRYLNTKENDQLTESVCHYADIMGLDTGGNDDHYIFISDLVGELIDQIYKYSRDSEDKS